MISRLHERVAAPANSCELATGIVTSCVLQSIIKFHTYSISVEGDYDYLHYLYDGTNDRGWGCGYRTLQTIISWIVKNVSSDTQKQIPSLTTIQEILVQVHLLISGMS